MSETASGVTFNAGGETLAVHPARLLYWPAAATLFAADLHLGKAAAFRRAGIPVPEGGSAADLERLGRAVEECGATRLVLLGDLLHAAGGRTQPVLDALAAWRARHPHVQVTLVRGNHDRHAGPPPAELGFALVEEPWPCGPFACRHAPQAGAEADGRYALAGHIHPVAVLADRDGARLRLPCLHARPHGAVLPAFGSFTGGVAASPAPGDRIFVFFEGGVAEVGGSRAAHRSA